MSQLVAQSNFVHMCSCGTVVGHDFYVAHFDTKISEHDVDAYNESAAPISFGFQRSQLSDAVGS